LGLTIEDLSRKCRLSHNVIARLERGESHIQPWVLGRILPTLAPRFKEAFPETNGDAYDFLIPPTSLGRWLKNQRLRRGMKLRELSEALIVNIYSVVRYESDRSKPSPTVRERLRRLLGDTPFL
jgi:transcriptional regulator with XRE-family HTH domain